MAKCKLQIVRFPELNQAPLLFLLRPLESQRKQQADDPDRYQGKSARVGQTDVTLAAVVHFVELCLWVLRRQDTFMEHDLVDNQELHADQAQNKPADYQ